MNRYPEETLDPDKDNGTMPNSVEELRQAVVGRRIVKAERREVCIPRYEGAAYGIRDTPLILTLDDGRSVVVADDFDCCAYTELEAFLTHPERVEHIITGVGTTDGYSRWHIYADMGDVLELMVGWSCGNPFYYAYGFNILVTDNPDTLLSPPTERSIS